MNMLFHDWFNGFIFVIYDYLMKRVRFEAPRLRIFHFSQGIVSLLNMQISMILNSRRKWVFREKKWRHLSEVLIRRREVIIVPPFYEIC